jgi:hypothetical protein
MERRAVTGVQMTRRGTGNLFTFGFALLLAIFGLGAKSSPGQSNREAEGARLLKGAIDMHFHMDPRLADGAHDEAVIETIRIAQARGIRGLVIKSHHEPTSTLAYQLRLEIPNIDLFGGVVMNRSNGGMNVDAVEYMATGIYGTPGKIVWMPAFDSEIESNPPYPKKPFVAVSRDGKLLPETKDVIAAVAKYDLILASGHIAPAEALMVFREGRSQGVHRMIATHAMDLAGKMNMDQMLEAAKLGAIIEFDFRNIREEDGVRMDAIRKIGPERCLISEFWTQKSPRVYAGLDGVGKFVEAMHARGLTDSELDMMFKENPAKLLGLASH